MHVDRPVAHDHVAAPNVCENFLPREYLLRFRTEQAQQLELLARKRQLTALAKDQIALPIDHDAARLPVGISGRRVESFEHGLDPAEQHPDMDRLGDIVVGARIEPGNLGIVLAPSRQKGYQRPAQRVVGANLAAGFDPVHLGHHHVEQNQMRHDAQRRLNRLASVRGRKYLVVLLFQIVAYEFKNVGFVVDKQDAIGHGCFCSIGTSSRIRFHIAILIN